MILNQFHTWARTAPTTGRADGISALARAYLYSNLDSAQRIDAVRVMTAFLDDPSTAVRRALAEALASAAEAPHHVVLALAEDCAGVASIVLGRSPLLTDAELIDCAATAEPAAQAAIAGRLDLSPPVAAALAEIAAPEALVALAHNRAASLPACALRRMVERHGATAELREALLARSDLPAAIRVELVAATAQALATFVTTRNWLSGERMQRVTTEASDRAAVTIATNDCGARRDLVAHLRRSGRLTTSFAFRAILSGRIELFKAMLVELSGLPALRVDALTRRSGDAAFAALYHRCGLPVDLLPAFRIALDAARGADWAAGQGGRLSLDAVSRVLTGCIAFNEGELDKLLALLRRFESEASREDVRATHRAAASYLGSEQEPLMLTSIDALDESGRVIPRATRSTSFAVDMDAIEAELLIA